MLKKTDVETKNKWKVFGVSGVEEDNTGHVGRRGGGGRRGRVEWRRKRKTGWRRSPWTAERQGRRRRRALAGDGEASKHGLVGPVSLTQEQIVEVVKVILQELVVVPLIREDIDQAIRCFCSNVC